MSFDKDTRNLLAKMVTACRRRLTEDVTSRLTGVFGLHPDGTVLALKEMGHLSPDQTAAAGRLRDLLDHYTVGAAGGEKDRRKSAYERMTLEISFTILNRLAALRLCEERGLVVECVRRGTASDGFRLFERVSGGALGGRYDTYRAFLECLFDELALDLGVLFDRTTPQSSVFPSERCMEDVLGELNKSDLIRLWTEDETIGWVYQYFNPPEERRAMRDASAAPRNSRELAVRNQFFTPRYVVEFLTDNTLGRIWYEMRKGDTALKDECRYLVRRPDDVFLAAGEKAPPEAEDRTDLSQEELLKQPVYIKHRPKKDPRDLRVLDPACGSGHFLLYAFDLLERIYEEAWGDPESPKFEATGRTLLEDFETLDDLRREIPKLIMEHNLHGIDIDSRSVQIAALALWLRAQKAWKNLGIKAAERPRVAKSNIVTAEPMPGEADMKEEFTTGLKPLVLGQIIDEVFEKMKLAGEAGSLLKIDEDIKDAVAAAGKQWREGPKPEQQLLFPTMDASTRPKQQELRFDVKGITDERFWEQAEERILDALKNYSEQAENGRVVRRRLFAEDAARGFSFVDLCRKRYDVVLMNPPFGEAIPITRSYLVEAYPTGSKEMATCFVEMGADFTHRNGLVGAITSRFMLANNGLIAWRKNEFLNEAWNIQSFADLGYGVLDGAMVEACSYIVGLNQGNADRPFINCLDDSEKGDALLSAIASLMTKLDRRVALRSLQSFRSVPDHIICYWLPNHLLQAVLRFDNLRIQGSAARVGLQTGDNERFARAVWEVDATNIGHGKDWFYFAKGGEYEPFYDDIHLVVFWKDDGYLLKRFVDKNGKLLSRPQNLDYFFHEGITYPDRTTSDFSPRVMPRGIIFSSTGFALFPPNRGALLGYLGSAYTRPFKVLVEAFVGSGDSSVSGSAARHYRPGILNLLPNLLPAPEQALQQKITRSIQTRIRTFEADETSRYFAAFPNLNSSTSIRNSAAVRWLDYVEEVVFLIETNVELEVAVRNVLGITIDDPVLDELYGLHPAALSASLPDAQEVMEAQDLSEEALIERLVSADGAGRSTVKKSYFADRRIELVCRIFRISPKLFAAILNEKKIAPKVFTHEYTQSLISFALGCGLGRWDIRYATGEKTAPELPDPFAPLPVCPPGQLQNAQGLPARSEDVHAGYPVRIPWNGILVDDPGGIDGWLPKGSPQPHPDDIVRRTYEFLDVLLKDKAHEIEQEACDILGVSDLRDYFRKPAKFFQDHLKRYSKSRRKAPIYWPLSTASGSYTIWIYYHRLNDQTLYAAVNQYLEPKISEIERGLARIEDELKVASGGEATRLRDRLNETQTFLGELRDLREELLRIAALPYKPDLNDGVIINAAPLNGLFNLRSWVNDTKSLSKKSRIA